MTKQEKENKGEYWLCGGLDQRGQMPAPEEYATKAEAESRGREHMAAGWRYCAIVRKYKDGAEWLTDEGSRLISRR